MGLCDHIDVISTITDSKRYFRREPLSDKVNNICFLLGRNSTSQNNVNFIWSFQEFSQKLNIWSKHCKSVSCNNNSLLLASIIW